MYTILPVEFEKNILIERVQKKPTNIPIQMKYHWRASNLIAREKPGVERKHLYETPMRKNVWEGVGKKKKTWLNKLNESLKTMGQKEKDSERILSYIPEKWIHTKKNNFTF